MANEDDYDAYKLYMDNEFGLDSFINELSFDNCNMFAEKLIEKDKNLAIALMEELKWQIKSAKN